MTENRISSMCIYKYMHCRERAYNSYAKLYFGDMEYMAQNAIPTIRISNTDGWMDGRVVRKRVCVFRADAMLYLLRTYVLSTAKVSFFGARSHTMRIFNAYVVAMYFTCVSFFSVPLA